MGVVLYIFLASLTVVGASVNVRKTDLIGKASATVDIDYQQKYQSVPVDHFGYANEDRFDLRYLINDAYYGGDKAPVFFYAGNEGDIEWFCNNTGLMWSWASEFQALLVFVEHRYYGKSMPYGADSYKDKSHLGYLTSEQALADFADVLMTLESDGVIRASSPVIAFGGSYGGMLAAWMRMKYPHVVEGSLAASAPILWFGNLTNCGAFSEIVTNDFAKSGPHCEDNIRASWKVITDLAQTVEGRTELKEKLHLCDDIKQASDADLIKNWLIGTYGNLAMVDYPYPASFLEPLPAWPIKAVCKELNIASPDDSTLIASLGRAIGVYYNYTGSAKCFNLSQQAVSSLGDQGWNFQACTEMTMPMCSTGVTDMFEPAAWSLDDFAAGCKEQFGITTRAQWAIKQYGGRDLADHSNIIFSNGALDPWSAGGVLSSPSSSLPVILIADGAHHLDLRAPHPDDPASVISARQQEKQIIQGWIKNFGTEESYFSVFTYYVVPGNSEEGASGLSLMNSVSMVGVLLAVICLAMVAVRISRKPSYRPLSSVTVANQHGMHTEKAPLL